MLNHLLFVDDLKLYGSSKPDIDSVIESVYSVIDDIDMRFEIDKYGIWTMRRIRI